MVVVFVSHSPEGGIQYSNDCWPEVAQPEGPKRGSAALSRSAELQFAAQGVRLGPVLGTSGCATDGRFHHSSLLAVGSTRSKLSVRSSICPKSNWPNQTLYLPSSAACNPTDQPASAPEMKIHCCLPQLMHPCCATL